jgi:3-oxoacyl-[acyl-carrier protein] reductase
MNDSAADRQIVLITGASRGIGRFLAEHFLAGDFAVIGLSRSAISTIDAPNYTHFEADIADEKAIVRTFAKIRETFGRLDIAINNAAIHKTTRMLMTSYADAKTAFDVNVIGTLIVSREAAKLMMRRRWGRIQSRGHDADSGDGEGILPLRHYLQRRRAGRRRHRDDG